jgi:predicted transposase YbfD/YdcC
VRGLRFPHVAQAARVERTTELSNGKVRHEVVYVITSLAPDRADAKRLLDLLRGHWSIEAVHYIRDVTYDEDRSRIRTGNGPQIMAALRNLAVAVLPRFLPGRTLPAAHLELIMNTHRLIDLIGA